MTERETLEVDVLIVGAGPAGLSAGIRLGQLARDAGRELMILIIEKGREVGAHGLSGAVMDPSAIRDLLPDFREEGAPVECEVTEDFIYRLREDEHSIFPFAPAPMRNEGKMVVSLAKWVRWMASRAEALGVEVYPEFPAVELLVEGDRVAGVRTGDKGIDKNGEKKGNFEAGVDIKAKVTVLADGPRGNLTRQAVEKFDLSKGRQPQVYATGVKEVWEIPNGRFPEGRVIHTMGWPLDGRTYGGGFLYAMGDDRVAVGFAIGLDYRDPFLDPHHEFQRFKTHPRIRSFLEGGKVIEYGAKTIPEGGWYAVPKLHMGGCLLAGDAAGLLNAMRLKGIHLAIGSGKLAGETVHEALEKDDFSEAVLSGYTKKVEASEIGRELRSTRSFKQGFRHGMLMGMINSGISLAFGGWSPLAGEKLEEGHKHMQTLSSCHGSPDAKPVRISFDGKLTLSKLDDVYLSQTQHAEDQPSHLKVLEPDICTERCTKEYGNPCRHFCPASVYEWLSPEENGGKAGLRINFSNCVHCKTCDVMDPYGIIRWTPPEGGGGPGWQNC